MIEVEHLSKVYGSTTAIQDVTFAVEPGEILGLLGPNGAGKTTTMRILAGYLPATSGTARIANYEVHENPMAVRQRIGYLPETPPLYPDMTVEGFLKFVARIKGVPAGDRTRQVNSALERCNLVEKRQVLIHKLSKGFRQRVGIAQAIVHDPPVIVLDEPTIGLDPRQIIDVRSLIKSLAGSHTIILSTHVLPEVSMTCNRVGIIHQGRVVATGTLENLMVQLTGGIGYELEVEGNAGGVSAGAEGVEGQRGQEHLLPERSGASPASPAALRQLLQVLPGVRLVELVPESSLPEDRLKLRVVSEPGLDLGREIASTLVEAGVGLYEMRRSRASLEDVFLKLTTEEKNLAGTDTTSGRAEADESERVKGEAA
jgi:ABC-2 type transport system ATP-binding protein